MASIYVQPITSAGPEMTTDYSKLTAADLVVMLEVSAKKLEHVAATNRQMRKRFQDANQRYVDARAVSDRP